jgi:XkdW protein
MLNLPLILLFSYPNARLPFDYQVTDNNDGNGPFISLWNTKVLGPQPNVTQLQQISISATYLAWLPSHGGDPIQTAYANAQNILNSTTDVYVLSMQGILSALASEIQKAVPTYVPPSAATLVQSAQTSLATIASSISTTTVTPPVITTTTTTPI